MRKLAIGALALTLGVSGCGGGGSGDNGGGGVAEVDFESGSISGRAAATNPPVTTSAQVTVATGVTGNFSTIRLREQSLDLQDTRLAIASLKSQDIYTCNIDGTNMFRVTPTTTLAEQFPSFSPGGNKIAFHAFDNTNQRDIFIYRSDGVFLTRVTNTPGVNELTPDWSPDGTKLVFSRNNQLIIYNTANSTETPIDTGGTSFSPVWGPGNRIMFVTNRSGNFDVYTCDPDGSNAAPILGTTADSDHLPVWSPDPNWRFFVKVSAGEYLIYRVRKSLTSESATSIHTSLTPIDHMDVTPDGEYVVFQNSDGIFRVHRTGGSPIFMFQPVDAIDGFSWGSLQTERLFVGVGGLFSAGAAGFIYSDAGAKTQSFLAFDCVTRSSALLRAQTGTGGSEDSLQFFLDGDTVNMLKFANAPDWQVITPVGAGSSVPTANGALISIGSTDGKVNAVIPFVGTRAANSLPTITRDGSRYVFEGELISAIDASGKNIAPSGASRVVLDPKTNALTAG